MADRPTREITPFERDLNAVHGRSHGAQRTFARLVGKPSQTVNRWIRGVYPVPREIKLLARAWARLREAGLELPLDEEEQRPAGQLCSLPTGPLPTTATRGKKPRTIGRASEGRQQP